MTLTEYLFCYSVAPHPPHPNHLSIVSGHALRVLKILPFCVDSLPVSFVYHFHWTLMVEICFLDLDLALVYPPFCIALSCCEKWPSQVLQRMTAVEKKLSTLLCNLLCPTCHKYSNGGSAGIPCAGLLVLLWLSGAERLPCSHGGHLTLETTRAQAYYILKNCFSITWHGPRWEGAGCWKQTCRRTKLTMKSILRL